MTDTSTAAGGLQAADFLRAWAETLAKVLAEIRGTSLPCTMLDGTPVTLREPAGDDLWIVAALSGGLRGELAWRLPASSTIGLAQVFMGEAAAVTAELKSEHGEAVVELFRQVGGLVATAVRGTGGEIQLQFSVSSGAPSWTVSSTAWMRVGPNEAATAWIEIQVSAALMAALRSQSSEISAEIPTAAVTAPSAAQSSVKLELLMDVELAVTLRFGSRRLLLREILDLNSGAVVELDRQVYEPVDLMLDGRVVARGEVVVVDGNYGLRVVEVAPRA